MGMNTRLTPPRNPTWQNPDTLYHAAPPARFRPNLRLFVAEEVATRAEFAVREDVFRAVRGTVSQSLAMTTWPKDLRKSVAVVKP